MSVPSYFASIEPRHPNDSRSKSMSDAIEDADTVSAPTGNFFPFTSHTDSVVLRCNNRLVKPVKSEVGQRLWKTITNLGVAGGAEVGTCIKLVEDMENRDSVGMKGKKGFKKMLL